MVALAPSGMVFVNPYTGQVLGEGNKGVRGFFRAVTDWHRWLATSGESRATGRAITGAANLAFLLLVMTGAYLWIPRAWSRASVRAVLWFRGGLRGRARDFNWHNTIGVWSVAPLFLIVTSGVVMSYPWANALVYRATGNEPPAPQQRLATPPRGQRPPQADFSGLDPLIARAAAQMPGWESISVRPPAAPDGAVTLAIDRGNGTRPDKRATLVLDRSRECRPLAAVYVAECRSESARVAALHPHRRSRRPRRPDHRRPGFGRSRRPRLYRPRVGVPSLPWQEKELRRSRRRGVSPLANLRPPPRTCEPDEPENL